MLLTTFALAVTAATVSAVPTLHPRAFIPDQASLVSIHPKGHTDKCLGAKDGVANMHDIVMYASPLSPPSPPPSTSTVPWLV